MSEELQPCFVRILHAGTGEPVGAGFLVGDKHVLTCAHVVLRALDLPDETPEPPDGEVLLDFPFLQSAAQPAHVEVWHPPGDYTQPGIEDVCILRLDQPSPADARPTRILVPHEIKGHTVAVYGFPAGHRVGVFAYAFLCDQVANRWWQVEHRRETAFSIQPGFSGGPVWDEQVGAVIGMVIASERDPTVRAGFILPGEILAEVVPAEISERMGRTVNVPRLPRHFLPRPEELNAIKHAVLAAAKKPVGVTGVAPRTGIQGMGGIGKSVLAAALARELDVRRAFPDGVIWITVGQQPDLIGLQADLARDLGDQAPAFQDLRQGKQRLRQLLASKGCLLILDDVWNAEHAGAFDALGPECQMLVTTRDASVVDSLDAEECKVDLLTDEQALTLLADSVGRSRSELPEEAAEIIHECGRLPLAVATVAAMLRRAPDRWDYVLHRLRSADLGKIHGQFPDYPYPDLLRAIEASVNALDPETRARYLDLAVFPEDTPIPEPVLQTFWAPEGLDQFDVLDVIDELVNRSLARRDDVGRLVLHDLQFDYVRKQVEDLPGLHGRLLNAYRAKCEGDWPSGPDDGYYFEHLAEHLVQAGREDELRRLLFDFDWMAAKLETTDVNALLADYDVALTYHPSPLSVFRGMTDLRRGEGVRGTDQPLALVQGAIRLSAHVLARDPDELRSQLYGRIMSREEPEIVALAQQLSAPTEAV